MELDVTVHLDRDVRLQRPLVLVGAPTAGLVGTIVAKYLVKALDMPCVGGVHSPSFPPVAQIRDGLATFPVRVYAKETDCGVDGACGSLVIMETEFVPGRAFTVKHRHARRPPRTRGAQKEPEKKDALMTGGAGAFEARHVLSAFSDAVVQWAEAQDAGLLVVPDAVPEKEPSGNGGGDVPVHGAASTRAALEILKRVDAGPVRAGTIVGLTASLLLSANRHGQDALALVSPSRPDVPDARAAARIVETLDKLVPAITMETQPLIEQAERIEDAVRKQQAKMQEQAELAADETPMYL